MTGRSMTCSTFSRIARNSARSSACTKECVITMRGHQPKEKGWDLSPAFLHLAERMVNAFSFFRAVVYQLDKSYV